MSIIIFCPTQTANVFKDLARGPLNYDAAFHRQNHVPGSVLRSSKLKTQTTETKITVKALNRMTHLGRAAYERVA